MIRSTLKFILKKLPIRFTQNQKYDAQTIQVIRRVCRPGSNCIDVGAHKGEVLDHMLRAAPQGTHYAFEPIPALFRALKQKYADRRNVQVFDQALSDKAGRTTFNYVVTNPSYSGLKKRKYDRKNEKDKLIEVETALLDTLIPPNTPIDLIKIDVEGGELQVLQGAAETIRRTRPVIIFEHGLGASEFYHATPEKLFDLLQECRMQVSTLGRWLEGQPALSRDEFRQRFYRRLDYYFIAYPEQ